MENIEPTTPIELREATIGDADLISGYHIETHLLMTNPMDAITENLHETEKHLILILENQLMIGFFILQTGSVLSLYTSNPHAILFKDHSIDRLYQQKGYAKRSLELLPLYIKQHFPSVNEIVLAVELDHLGAQILYMRAGFENTKRKLHINDHFYFIFSKGIS